MNEELFAKLLAEFVGDVNGVIQALLAFGRKWKGREAELKQLSKEQEVLLGAECARIDNVFKDL